MRARSVLSVVVLAASVAGVALGQTGNPGTSRWGQEDQRGAANRITPQKVLEAKSLITRGTVYQLGHVYESSMPLFGTRHFSLKIPQTFGPMGSNRLEFHDEIVSAELGQVGTQFDGLGHIGVGDVFYTRPASVLLPRSISSSARSCSSAPTRGRWRSCRIRIRTCSSRCTSCSSRATESTSSRIC